MKFDLWSPDLSSINQTLEHIWDDLPDPDSVDRAFDDLHRIADALETLAHEAKDAGDARRAAVARAEQRQSGGAR